MADTDNKGKKDLSDDLQQLSHTQADPSGAARASGRRTVPVPFRVPHPLPLCRGQIRVIRSIDEDCHIQVLNETIHLPAHQAHELVRVVIRTGPQTLSVYWTASQQGRIKRIVHRA